MKGLREYTISIIQSFKYMILLLHFETMIVLFEYRRICPVITTNGEDELH